MLAYKGQRGNWSPFSWTNGNTLHGRYLGHNDYYHYHSPTLFAKLSQAKPQLQLSWLALASLNFP